MSVDLFKIKQRLIAEGRTFAVATIAAPLLVPPADSNIVLTDDGQVFGSTGHADMDEAITTRLREFIHEKENNAVVVVQCPSEIRKEIHGKHVQTWKILMERFAPTPQLVIIGAGDVGLAVARLAADLDFRIVVVDERADLANPQRFPMADSILCEPDLLQALSLIPFDESCYIVVAFQANDDRAIRYCLTQPWAYCGVLGSKNRIRALWETLRSEGAQEQRLGAVHAPIGFDIGAQTPQEIAIAILAEILAVRNKKSFTSCSPPPQ